MSYILEALKKSDQQRQRGTTPTLQAVQVTVAAPKRPLFIYYSLFAAVLLGVGITIGWLHNLQVEQPSPETEPISVSQQAAPAPLAVPSEMPGKTAQDFPALNSTPAVQPAPRVNAMKPDDIVSAGTGTPGTAASITEKVMPEKALPEKLGSPAGVAQEQRAIPMSELPLQIQQEIPAMAIQLHAYSSTPPDRLVSINFRSLREGAYVTPDLRLEQITPDGMIFSYKGYRFQRGIR